MRERNDQRFAEDVSVTFAMYCDEAGLTLEDGLVLAEEVYDQLFQVAEDRSAYLSDAKPSE